MARNTAVKIDENAPKTLAEAIAKVEDPAALLLAIVDRAVRDARDANWCDTFEAIMGRVAPELQVSVSYTRKAGGPGLDWVDSDGVNCQGIDTEGYKNGFHRETGLDRDGYKSDGFHPTTGLDRSGRDRYGDDPNDPTSKFRFAWTRNGDPSSVRYEREYYLSDRDGYQPNGGPAYNRGGNYLTRGDLALLRAQGDAVFKYDRLGNEAPASE